MPSTLQFVLFIALAASYVQSYQHGFGYYNPYYYYPTTSSSSNYFRSGLPQSSIDTQVASFNPELDDGRFFFGQLTITLASSTSTTTVTSTTVCTTSTSALKSCTPSGRRRRGMSMGDHGKYGGLFYDDQEGDSEDGSIFLPSPKNADDESGVKPEQPKRSARQIVQVPYIVQPGFQVPRELGNGRYLLAFTSSITTVTSTTTSTSTLTATCSSTTAFQTCGSTGK